MIQIQGIGWIDESHYGTVRRAKQSHYAQRATLDTVGQQDGLFRGPIKNFGRFDRVTRLVCTLTALALEDGGLVYGSDNLDIGLLGLNPAGCLAANRSFYTDYVEAGRTLSRANLFIYTLPTSPLAEAAIHFGLSGPLLYLDPLGEVFVDTIETVTSLLGSGQTKQVLLYRIEAMTGWAALLGEREVEQDDWQTDSLPEDLRSDIQDITATLKKSGY